MALAGHLKSVRERLATALQAMDYEQALTFQVEVDDLQDRVAAEEKAQSGPLWAGKLWAVTTDRV
jgi:hypothetical protein